VESAERWCDLQWTLTDFADRMTTRAVGLKNNESPLRCRGENLVALCIPRHVRQEHRDAGEAEA